MDLLDDMLPQKTRLEAVMTDDYSNEIHPEDYQFAFQFELQNPQSQICYDSIDVICEKIETFFSSIRTITDTSDVIVRASVPEVSDGGRITVIDREAEFDLVERSSDMSKSISFIICCNGYLNDPDIIIRMMRLIYHLKNDYDFYSYLIRYLISTKLNFRKSGKLTYNEIDYGRMDPSFEESETWRESYKEEAYRKIIKFAESVLRDDFSYVIGDAYRKFQSQKLLSMIDNG